MSTETEAGKIFADAVAKQGSENDLALPGDDTHKQKIFIIGICSAVGVIILLASIYLYCGIDRKCSGCKRPIKWWQSRKVGTDYEDTVYHRIGCYDERMTRKWDAGRDTALRKTMREERLAEEDEAQLERERKMGFPDRV